MEWLDQTKKLSKSADYITLDAVDSVFDVLWYIDHSVLLKHKKILNEICARYHKPNPLHYHSREKVERLYKKKNGHAIQADIMLRLKRQFQGELLKTCFGTKDWKSCTVSRFGIAHLSGYVDSSLRRCEMVQKDANWAWFEVIDYMWERPEQINPDSIDEYVIERVNYICETARKNNPLKNGVQDKFGKEWKDDDGHWQKERRKRF